jgi:hypothetical protein
VLHLAVDLRDQAVEAETGRVETGVATPHLVVDVLETLAGIVAVVPAVVPALPVHGHERELEKLEVLGCEARAGQVLGDVLLRTDQQQVLGDEDDVAVARLDENVAPKGVVLEAERTALLGARHRAAGDILRW